MSPATRTAAPARPILADRVPLLGTEQAFHLVSRIAEVEQAQDCEVIRCNIGQPDFPLPDHIRSSIERSLRAGATGYCDPQGLPELRAAIAEHAGARRGLVIDPARVVVFPGARAAIGFAQQTYCDVGDDVVFPTPSYPLYESFISYVGARAVPIPLREANGFVFDPQEMAAHIGCWTKLIFLNFPSNPTGVVASRHELEELADEILTYGPAGVRVYSDESYEDIIFDGLEHRSIASVPGMEERTIIVSGVSKSYAWTGGRIGWAILPTTQEAAVFKNLNINYFGSISPYNQEGARTALESPESIPVVRAMVESFQERRDIALPLLNAVSGVSCQEPKGAFYLFPNIEGLLRSLGAIDAYDGLPQNVREQTSPATLFQMFLLHRHHVAIMDRRSFGVLGSEGEHFVRFSIATGIDDLREAIARLARAGEDRAGFEDFMANGGGMA